MKYEVLLLSLVGVLGFTACEQEEPAAENKLILNYSHPAQYFEESLPIGNGQLGALIYGGVAEERLSLNDITLWTGGPGRDAWGRKA